MMASHLLFLGIFAFFVSLVFALLARDDPREQWRFAGRLFAVFIVTALVVGWLMYPFPM
jgi:hypothetical protein